MPYYRSMSRSLLLATYMLHITICWLKALASGGKTRTTRTNQPVNEQYIKDSKVDLYGSKATRRHFKKRDIWTEKIFGLISILTNC